MLNGDQAEMRVGTVTVAKSILILARAVLAEIMFCEVLLNLNCRLLKGYLAGFRIGAVRF